MDTREYGQQLWHQAEKPFLFQVQVGPKTLKSLQIGCILALGIMGFYLLPGNWAFLSIAWTPILVFITLFSKYFRETVLSDSGSHAPLTILGLIYVGICWYVVTAP